MENTILQLIKIIAALFFNDKAEDDNEQIFEEVQLLLTEVKIDPRASSSIGGEESIIDALRYTAEWMVTNRDGSYNRKDIIQRLAVNMQGNLEYIGLATDLLDEEITIVDARKRVSSIMRELRYDKRRTKLRQFISKANAKLNFSGEYIEISPFVSELMMGLEEVNVSPTGEIEGFIGGVDFTNEGDIEKALTKGVELADAKGMLNTGFQGLNRACGGYGIHRGSMVNFGALTHHYKSGMLNDLCLNIAQFNDPCMLDSTKKPMILRISFENTIDQDTMILYKKLYEIKYQRKCDIASANITEAGTLLLEHFQQRGYTFHMMHFDPANFCIYDLFDILKKFIDLGFEIHAVVCDYLSQIAGNTIGDRHDSKIQKTYEMARNFCYPKGITFLTGHQLSTEAQNLSKESSANFTKKVCTGGWYMDCRSLHTKLDLEFVMHIHSHVDGCSYLTLSRGKHRGGESTPQKHRHFMYRFEEFGGIVPDIDGDSKALYALPSFVSSADEAAMSWD